MRFMGWATALGVVLVALIAGVIGYNIGIGQNLANLAVANGTAVAPAVYPYYHWGWGFGFGGGFFGIFFFIILLVIIFSVIRRAAWGGRGGWGRGWGGGYGHHGYWKYGPGPDDAFERWHRQAHGEPEPTGNDPVTGRPTTGPTSPPTNT